MDDDIIESEADLERLELVDQAEEVGFLTPREYAKLHGMQPQLVYYYIRTKQLEVELCKCGRKVIDVVKADTLFASKKKTGIVDTRSDEEQA
jgi:hypothetical protein